MFLMISHLLFLWITFHPIELKTIAASWWFKKIMNPDCLKMSCFILLQQDGFLTRSFWKRQNLNYEIMILSGAQLVQSWIKEGVLNHLRLVSYHVWIKIINHASGQRIPHATGQNSKKIAQRISFPHHLHELTQIS